jgi:NMD protein affecting ribosome stability and mRNA decay
MNTKQKRNERKTNWLQEHGPCEICGSSESLQIHHKDPSQKVASEVWLWSQERREEELSKCMVVCEECHKNIHVEIKRQKIKTQYHPDRKLINCKRCKRDRPPKGRGLCDSCYRKHQRESKVIICKECGEEKHPFTKDLCNACYSRLSRKNPNKRRLIVCKSCGEEKYHEGLGLCQKCYKKDYIEKKKNLIICEDCGEEKQHLSRNLCAKCYMRRKRAENKEKPI